MRTAAGLDEQMRTVTPIRFPVVEHAAVIDVHYLNTGSRSTMAPMAL